MLIETPGDPALGALTKGGFQENTRCLSISVWRTARAFLTRDRRRAFSSSGPRAELPKGLTIFWAGRILLEPTISATRATADKWAVGIPALSISFVSVAPQRVLVPQVEVRMTPETPSYLRFSAICFAQLLHDGHDARETGGAVEPIV